MAMCVNTLYSQPSRIILFYDIWAETRIRYCPTTTGTKQHTSVGFSAAKQPAEREVAGSNPDRTNT